MPEPVPPAIRRIVLAWVLILGCLAVVMGRNAAADAQRADARKHTDGAAADAEPGLPTGPELQMRYLVGLHVLSPTAPLSAPVAAMVAEIGARGSERERLALVPVLGEVAGEQAARDRLQVLDRAGAGLSSSGQWTLAALHALYPADPDMTPRRLAVPATGAVPAVATGATTVAAARIPEPATAAVTATGPVVAGRAAAAPPVDRHLGVAAAKALVQGELGWAGQLAVGHTDPGGAVEAGALATAAHMAAAVFLFVLIAVAALACAVGFTVAMVRGTLKCAYVPDADHNPAWVEVFALYLAAFIGTGEILHHFDFGSEDASLAATWVFIAVAPLLYAVLRVSGVDHAQIRAGLGWNPGAGGWSNIGNEIAAGIGGWLAGAPVVVLMAVIASVLSRRAGLDLHPDHPLVGIALAGHGWMHWLILISVASGFAPIVEETMFRGALFHHLRGWWTWPAAALVGGLVFAALHPQGLSAIPPLCAMAIIFTAIRTWRGTMIANAAAHACNNGVVLIVLWCVQS
jgi:membrane protease YdiL (CAAX protease family)